MLSSGQTPSITCGKFQLYAVIHFANLLSSLQPSGVHYPLNRGNPCPVKEFFTVSKYLDIVWQKST